MRFHQAWLAAASALVLSVSCRPALAAPLQALSAQDVQLYAQAFDAAERGDKAQADLTLSRVADPCLAGRVRYLELTYQPKTASFDELSDWLKSFGDLPGADRVYALALRRKPAGAMPPAPTAPPIAAPADSLDRDPDRPSAQSKAAREAYFGGDLRRALDLAKQAGDAWIAGLAAYRTGAFADALASFQSIAANTAETDARRAAGAFWAARAAIRAGLSDQATGFLKIAAAVPDTFYGMIAVRKLQLSDDPLGRVIDAVAGPMARPGGATVRDLVDHDARARRAVALAQIGRSIDAGAEVRAGVAAAADDHEKALWMGLAYQIGSSGPPPGEIVLHSATAPSASAYPTPTLTPTGGFTVDRALVYAVVWQESRFNSLAVSPVGAIGLMQLMPPSAASVGGDATLTIDPVPLFDTGKNLQLGQAYLNWLMERAVGYDILRAVAAYNGGPSTINRALDQVGPDADSLTLIESVPFAETRDYVRKVMAAYWSYRRQFGLPTRTLDALASDSPFIDARLDFGSNGTQDPQPSTSQPARQALEILLHRSS
jgi:soluble lytic murein transglycosylase-like protein